MINKKIDSFEAAYTEYADMLYRLALSNVGNRADAEDAVHDVFVSYCNASPKFSDKGHEKAWFIRSTVNRCRDLLRRHKIREYTPLHDPDLPEPAAETEGNADVFACLSCLDEKYRSVVTLHYLEGYSVDEIAHILRLSRSAVKMRLLRARESLKEIL